MKHRLILVVITSVMVVLLMLLTSCLPASTPPAMPPGQGPGHGGNPNRVGVDGTLTKIDSNTLTLNTAQGNVAINVSTDTIIQKIESAALSDISKGAFVFISGSPDTTGTIIATSIRIQPESQSASPPPPARTPPPQGGMNIPRQRQGAIGTVTGIASNVLTLNSMQGSVTVNIGSDTVIYKTVTGSLADLRETQSLSVMGDRDTDGNITATFIRIQPAGQGGSPPPAGS
jgi:hypothetical protein